MTVFGNWLPHVPARLRSPRPAVVAVLVGVAAWVGTLAFASQTHATIGPFETTVSVRAATSGRTTVDLPPLGTVRFDTHDGPLALGVRVETLREAEARQLLRNPRAANAITDELADDATRALRDTVLRAVLLAIVAAGLAGLLVVRSLRAAGVSALTAVALTVGTGGLAAATWSPDALAEPRFTGLLTSAPRIIGETRDVVSNFAEYRAQLARLVGNVAELYQTGTELPTYRADPTTTRVLHVSDVHLNPEGYDLVERIVDQFQVDAVVDTGDLTDFGTPAEARIAQRIPGLGVPYLYVKGNHDSAATVAAVRAQRNAVVLDGTATTVAGVRFAGFADPRFTPDKSTGDDENQKEIVSDFADALPQRLAGLGTVDVLLLHDPAAAADVFGAVPVVLAGHRHKVSSQRRDGTLLLVQGSTGGAGLRALEHDKSTPLTLSVLYFGALSGRLEAYDEIVVAGLGESSVEIRRHVVRPSEPQPTPSGS